MPYTGYERIVHDAFNMACGRNPHLAEQPYYHSDGGAQFTSKATTELIERLGFIKSVSRPGVPQDNQPIESFWKTLKREMPSIRHMRFDEAKMTIVKYIELYSCGGFQLLPLILIKEDETRLQYLMRTIYFAS